MRKVTIDPAAGDFLHAERGVGTLDDELVGVVEVAAQMYWILREGNRGGEQALVAAQHAFVFRQICPQTVQQSNHKSRRLQRSD